MTSPKDRQVTFWVVMKATKSRYGTYNDPPYVGQTQIAGIRASKMTVNKPECAADEVCFQVVVDVSETWFLDGAATIKASLPSPPQGSNEIQATVDVPVRGRAKSPAAGTITP